LNIPHARGRDEVRSAFCAPEKHEIRKTKSDTNAQSTKPEIRNEFETANTKEAAKKKQRRPPCRMLFLCCFFAVFLVLHASGLFRIPYLQVRFQLADMAHCP